MTPLLLLLLNLGCYAFVFVITARAYFNGVNSLQECLAHSSAMIKINKKHLLISGGMMMILIIHSSFNSNFISWFIVPSIKSLSSFTLLIVLVILISCTINIPNMVPPFPGNMPVLISYFLIRTLYLGVYEIFFRISLVESLKVFTGTYFAVIFSTLLYGLLHSFSRKMEYYTSFFFGLLLCWLAEQTKSILPAIFIHLLLSLPYEIRIVHHSKTFSNETNIFNRRYRLPGK